MLSEYVSHTNVSNIILSSEIPGNHLEENEVKLTNVGLTNVIKIHRLNNCLSLASFHRLKRAYESTIAFRQLDINDCYNLYDCLPLDIFDSIR